MLGSLTPTTRAARGWTGPESRTGPISSGRRELRAIAIGNEARTGPRMEGKIILITGGAGVLGQTVVPAFVSAGASVILGDRNPVPLPGAPLLKVDLPDQPPVRGPVNHVIHTI